jgi:hypothetical protein
MAKKNLDWNGLKNVVQVLVTSIIGLAWALTLSPSKLQGTLITVNLLGLTSSVVAMTTFWWCRPVAK